MACRLSGRGFGDAEEMKAAVLGVVAVMGGRQAGGEVDVPRELVEGGAGEDDEDRNSDGVEIRVIEPPGDGEVGADLRECGEAEQFGGDVEFEGAGGIGVRDEEVADDAGHG